MKTILDKIKQLIQRIKNLFNPPETKPEPIVVSPVSVEVKKKTRQTRPRPKVKKK